MAPSIGIVIPVAQDADALSELLDTIGRFTRQPDEIIVVSSEHDSELDAIVANRPCTAIAGPSIRGAQLDAGARHAQTDVLLFLHADASPTGGSLDAIERTIDAGAESGCFKFQFQGPRTWYKRLLERLIALRVRCGGIAYGDQGLFMTRACYDECGGFPARPLFEEVPLVRALRRRGTFRALSEPVAVSTRRWDRDGWLRRTLHNRWLATCFMLGVSPERLASRYYRLNDEAGIR